MASINYIFEHLSSSAEVTSLTPIDIMETSESLTAGKKYLILVTAGVGGNSSGDVFTFRLQAEGSTLIGSNNIVEPNSASKPQGYSYANIYTPSSNTTIKMQAGGSATIQAKLYRCEILALDLSDLTEDDDYFFFENNSLAAHGTSWSQRASYALSPNSSNEGTWLVIGGCSIDVNDAEAGSYQMKIQQDIDSGRGGGSSTDSPIMVKEGEDVSEISVDFISKAYNVNASDGETEWFLKTKDGPLDTANSFSSGRIIGLRTSVFLDVTSTWSEDDVTLASTFTTIQSGTHVSAYDTDVVFLGSAIADLDATGRSINDRFLWDSSEPLAMPDNVANRSNDALDEIPFHSMGVITNTSIGTHSYDWQGKASPPGLVSEDNSLVIFSTMYDPNEITIASSALKSVGRKLKEKTAPGIPSIGQK
jgi:hypothetical protein